MKSQRKLDRYARYSYASGNAFYYPNRIIAVCKMYFPIGLRQWAADQILLRVVALEYGVNYRLAEFAPPVMEVRG